MPNLDSYFPFDAGAGADVTEAEWRQMATHWRTSGVIIDGVTDQMTPVAASGNVRIQPGRCWIQGHFGELTGNDDLTPTAAHASLDRIDVAVIRMNATTNVLETAMVDGTAAASPTVPALTQTSSVYEIPIAHVRVVGGSGTLTVTDFRDFSHGPGEMPIGSLVPFCVPFVPPGWLFCYGQAVSRIRYNILFENFATNFGAGDGSTTFNVPDMRGRVPVGLDNIGGTDAGRLTVANTLGGVGGTQTHTLTENEMPTHDHGAWWHAGAADHNWLEAHVGGGAADQGGNLVGNAGGGAAHNNMQPYILLSYIVKAL